MARINIEDSLFTDPRYIKLVIKTGDQYKALGLLFAAFQLAQKHWLRHKKIPKENWISDFNDLLDCGLAEILDCGSVYIKGSKEQFGWLEQRSEAGKKTKIVENYVDKKTKNIERPLTTVDGTTTEANETEPLTLSLTHSLKDNNINNILYNNTIARNDLTTVTEPKKMTVDFVNQNFAKIKKDLFQSWAETYPKEYLQMEYKKARSWILANTHKAPKSNYGRFLNNWFNNGWEKYRKTMTSNQPKASVDELMDFMGWQND